MFTTSTTVSKGGAVPFFLGMLLTFAVSIEARAQEVEREIVGKVIAEESKLPLIGATVKLKGANASSKTDEQGIFKITDTLKGSVIIVSYVGFETKQVRFDSMYSRKGQMLNISLKLKETTLENVTIYSTGYEKVPRDRATGSFVRVDNQLFNRRVSGNVIDRILDVTSGLVYNRNLGGGDDQLSGLMIRGVSSINANVKPLIILDGFPYEGNLNNINPNDIDGVTVLRDAAAASIWGVRAGNGVIVITTKKGVMNKKVNIQLNANVTIGKKPNLFYLPTISSAEEIAFEKQQFKAGNYNTYDDDYPVFNYFPILPPVAEILLANRRGVITAKEANDRISALENHDVRNDINKYLLQNSINQQYALSFSGGSQVFSYYASAGYDRSRSNAKGDEYERMTFRMDNTYNPIEKLEINGFIAYTQSRSSSNGNNYMRLMPTGKQVAPYTMLADNRGNSLAIPKPDDGYRLAYVDTASYPSLMDWHYKPLDELKYNDNTSSQFDTRIGGGVKYSFFPGLKGEVQGQYQKALISGRNMADINSYMVRDLINQYMDIDPATGNTIYPVPLGNILMLNNSEQTVWSVRSQLNFNKRWGKHSVVALAGSEIRESTTEYNSRRMYGYEEDVYSGKIVNSVTLFNTRPGGNALSIPEGSSILGIINRYGSYYSNGAYTYGDKYTFTASGRIDQSNFFGVKANQRRVPLWSTGLSWTVSNEAFYHLRWLSYLKVRATYGYNGNTNNSASAFATIGYNSGTTASPDLQYARILNPPNPELRWERVRVINWGLDFEGFEQRIGGSIEYYTKKGLDLIGPVMVDPTSGVKTFTGNKASLKGSGVDFTFNSRIIDRNFKWYSNFLLSYNTDKVTSYEVQPLNGPGYLGEFTPIVGQPLYKINSYRWAGLDPETGAPRIYLGDTISNNNNYYNAKATDIIFNGRSTPRIFGALRNTFSWRKLSLSLNITYKLGYYFRRTSIVYSNLFSGWGGHSDYNFRWQKPGDEKSTNVPALPITQYDDSRDQVYPQSDILVEKADHIRLQDIRLSYDISKSDLRKLPFRNVQMYMYVNNIGIIWRANKHGIDPDFGSYDIPSPLSFAIGMNINF